MSNQVKFSYGKLANYQGLSVKDAGTVYFITDAPYIYFNGVKYGVADADIAAISSVEFTGNNTLTINYLNGAESKTITLAEATQSVAGLMSAADKVKLDNLKSQADLTEELAEMTDAIEAAQKTADDHIANGDVHITSDERTKLGDIDASLVGVAASKLPVSEATQAELDKKVDAEDGKSLVSDTLITKLEGLKSQDEFNTQISGLEGRISTNEGAITTINGELDTLEGEIGDVEQALNDFIATKATANGLASLDENGHVPASQLPSFVDDVVEAANFAALPEAGEASKIYVTLDDNKTYRWGGTTYVEISSALALGETTGTAYEGSKGKANADAIAAHVADKENPHNVTAAQLNIDASLVGVAASALPVSTATQAELDKKVAIESGKSLVSDTEIAKLAGLKSQTEISSEISTAASNAQSAAIAAAKTETEGQVSAAKTELEGKITAEATARQEADEALAADIKKNTDAIAALAGEGEGSVTEQISAAKEELQGNINKVEEDYKKADETLTQGVADNKAAHEANAKSISDLDTAVADFKNKNVGTAISAPGSDEILPTTKAVVDYVKAATDGVANSMTYTAKDGDASKMELKLIAVDGSTLSTIELDKENFLSNFVKRTATAEDVAADSSIAEGDPILVVTLVNGDVFRVNLKSLVDVYTGVANKAITTSVDGYVVKAQLNIDSAANTASAVKLTEGDNGLSAALAIDSAKNGANGITLAQDGNGLSAALKVDAATNTANGTEVTVGANGMSVAILWNEF